MERNGTDFGVSIANRRRKRRKRERVELDRFAVEAS